MTLQPINPYHIIEELTSQVAELKVENEELKEENEELRKLIPTDEEAVNE